jgi:hypothetical protein
MKNTLLILIFLAPIIALGQEKNYSKNDLQSKTRITNHPILNHLQDSEKNLETVLIDDRKFSKSLVQFDFDKSYSLSFTDNKTNLFKFIDNNDQNKRLLESEPYLDLKWRFKQTN